MRIALVGPTYPYGGGVAQHTTALAHELAARGHSVVIESWSRQYPELLYPGRQRVVEPDLPIFADTRYDLAWNRPDSWWRVGRRLGDDADIVVPVLVTPWQAPAIATLVRAVHRRTPVVVVCHNVAPHERRVTDSVLTRLALARADGVLVHGDEERGRASLLTSATIRSAPLPLHLPGGIEGQGDRGPRATATQRRLLFFGLVRPYKGVDVLLRALAVGPSDVNLVVAGEFWGGVDATAALVDELGLGDRVELRPGYVDASDIAALFAEADALVLPYRHATATQNVALAHHHGLPVVATRAGTLPVEVQDGVDGLLCEPDDVKGLAAALDNLYRPGVLDRLRAGITTPDAGRRWDVYVDRLLGLASLP
ncbi:MAG: D-inositol-3-phosphate glycosyltransferase [Actinomycetota bacterium]|jgi:glycosyltransferase involved in cell wall biosynthesis|nr:D-inositol-3-phosphate glycosyltransferase [Actinomycetota bacterium]